MSKMRKASKLADGDRAVPEVDRRVQVAGVGYGLVAGLAARGPPPSCPLNRTRQPITLERNDAGVESGLLVRHHLSPAQRAFRLLHTHNRVLYTTNVSRHPHKEIRKALDEAEAAGLSIIETSGHTWGWVRCPCGQRIAVYSTGRNPEHGAKLIRAFVRTHREHT
jgi:hypothetical protein